MFQVLDYMKVKALFLSFHGTHTPTHTYAHKTNSLAFYVYLKYCFLFDVRVCCCVHGSPVEAGPFLFTRGTLFMASEAMTAYFCGDAVLKEVSLKFPRRAFGSITYDNALNAFRVWKHETSTYSDHPHPLLREVPIVVRRKTEGRETDYTVTDVLTLEVEYQAKPSHAHSHLLIVGLITLMRICVSMRTRFVFL